MEMTLDGFDMFWLKDLNSAEIPLTRIIFQKCCHVKVHQLSLTCRLHNQLDIGGNLANEEVTPQRQKFYHPKRLTQTQTYWNLLCFEGDLLNSMVWRNYSN